MSSMEGRLSPRALSLDATCKALANLSLFLTAALSLITGRFALRRGPTCPLGLVADCFLGLLVQSLNFAAVLAMNSFA